MCRMAKQTAKGGNGGTPAAGGGVGPLLGGDKNVASAARGLTFGVVIAKPFAQAL